MKNLILLLIIYKIISASLSAQNIKGANEFFRTNNITLKPVSDTSLIDPYSFFPSQVGDFWQYRQNSSVFLSEEYIVKDTLLGDSAKYIYYEYWQRPTYKIDTNYNVIFDPEFAFGQKLYKLDAKIGKEWWVYSYYHDSLLVGELAEVDTLYEGTHLGRNSFLKVIKYYMVVPDGNQTLKLWDRDVVLASGMGLVYEDMDSEAPKVLISAIIDGDTLGTLVNVEKEIITTKPSDFALSQNYPNPFNSSTVINYSISEAGYYRMILTNILGEIIETTEFSYLANGIYKKVIDLNNYSSGIYFYTLFNNKKHETIKMIYLK